VLGASTEERRVVTVLFADLVGYAALTERPAYREHVMVSYDDLRVV